MSAYKEEHKKKLLFKYKDSLRVPTTSISKETLEYLKNNFEHKHTVVLLQMHKQYGLFFDIDQEQPLEYNYMVIIFERGGFVYTKFIFDLFQKDPHSLFSEITAIHMCLASPVRTSDEKTCHSDPTLELKDMYYPEELFVVSPFAFIGAKECSILSSEKEWFNDSIINEWMTFLTSPGIMFLESFCNIAISKDFTTFCGHLQKKESVVDELASQKSILIPVHRKNHWSLCIIELRPSLVVIYQDSIYFKEDRVRNQVIDNAKLFIRNVLGKKGTIRVDIYNKIRQSNGYDCGPIMCEMAECYCENREISIDSIAMRKHMHDILCS